MKKMKFGILGAGMAANLHAKALRDSELGELAAVADNNYEAARAFAEKWGISAFESYEKMLESDIDAVCICTPSYFHTENAILALKCGKHAVVEKPMALNVADADRVISAAEEYGRLVSVISQFRFSCGLTAPSGCTYIMIPQPKAQSTEISRLIFFRNCAATPQIICRFILRILTIAVRILVL
jgi:predicted dehydrogenase